ncbi:unnamed protein product [Didymodactylos carnosus]|uniref:Uncharacterized protein n=1 Tax=Didymodactylos carnosus TaxID=1234261 RepID=A0A8S2DC75_9BILA|nr:unnamed protein product [Didymodactylos carnosus]CAF3683261.1 unnamed protein product [Didymodactylos carnosus]
MIIEFEEFIIWYHQQQEDILHSLTTINNVIEYFKQSSNNKQHNTENCMIKLETEMYQQLLEAKPDLFEPILSKIQTDMNDLWRSSSKIFNVIQHQTNLFDIYEHFFDKSIDKPEHDISHLFNDKIRQFEKYLYHYDRENVLKQILCDRMFNYLTQKYKKDKYSIMLTEKCDRFIQNIDHLNFILSRLNESTIIEYLLLIVFTKFYAHIYSHELYYEKENEKLSTINNLFNTEEQMISSTIKLYVKKQLNYIMEKDGSKNEDNIQSLSDKFNSRIIEWINNSKRDCNRNYSYSPLPSIEYMNDFKNLKNILDKCDTGSVVNLFKECKENYSLRLSVYIWFIHY